MTVVRAEHERLPGGRVLTMAIAAMISAALMLQLGAFALAEDDSGDGVWFPAANMQVDRTTSSPLVLDDGRLLVSLRTPRMYDPYSGEVTVGTEHHEANLEFSTGWALQHRALTADGRVIAAGGTYSAGVSPGSTGSTDRTAIYDPVRDEWSDASPMSESRNAPSIDLLNDGSVLVAGGEFGGGLQLGSARHLRETAERYIVEEDRWVPAGTLNEPRVRHSSVVLEDGRVVIVGGSISASEASSSVETFDPNSSNWSVLTGDVPDDIGTNVSMLMPDGSILVLGGFDRDEQGHPLHNGTNAWSLNPNSGEFTQLSSMRESRTFFNAALLADGSVLVSGGRDAAAPGTQQLSSAERYLADSDTWEIVAAMNHPRVRHQIAALGDNAQGAAAFVVGGVDNQTEIGNPELFYLNVPGNADRQPPPSTDVPSHRYYPVTGHYLSHGFKDFWDESGGLPVFGYPLTREFDEFNDDLGEYRTSQYVERQRFEYHPENAGTPYEVQLGRLGYAEARDRDLLDTEWFATIDEDEINQDCVYFSATGQAACDEFLTYWQTHGLEFGDAGVSFRESLALFGYPISQKFEDPDTGLVTQYFERARFELHPDNPEEYRVLLGRLGADIVQSRDW